MVEVRPLPSWLLQGQGMAGVRPLTWTMTIARLGWLYMFERLDKAMLVPGQSQLDSLTQEVVGVSSVSLHRCC